MYKQYNNMFWLSPPLNATQPIAFYEWLSLPTNKRGICINTWNTHSPLIHSNLKLLNGERDKSSSFLWYMYRLSNQFTSVVVCESDWHCSFWSSLDYREHYMFFRMFLFVDGRSMKNINKYFFTGFIFVFIFAAPCACWMELCFCLYFAIEFDTRQKSWKWKCCQCLNCSVISETNDKIKFANKKNSLKK